jgi:hypothetical protein
MEANTPKPRAITVITHPPQEREDEGNDWYSSVHSPGRFGCGFLAFRRFEIVPDQPLRSLPES